MKNKTYNLTCTNIINISIIVLSIILIVAIIYYYVNDYMSIKEGLSLDDLVNCNNTIPLICGTSDTSLKQYNVLLGTCEEAYGATSQDPCGVLLSYCVDEVTPNIKTPTDNQNSSVTSSVCSLLSHTYNKVQADLTHRNPDGTDCRLNQ